MSQEKFSKNHAQAIDKSFNIMLYLKLIFASGETLAGVLLYFFKNASIHTAIDFLTSGELAENPKAFIASHILQFGQLLTVSSQRLAAIYLLLHGLVKLITLILLFRKKLWAYPLSILVFIGFIAYQMREFALTHHYTMIALTLFDLVMIWLTYLEYRQLQAQMHAEESSVV